MGGENESVKKITIFLSNLRTIRFQIFKIKSLKISTLRKKCTKQKHPIYHIPKTSSYT